MQGQSGSSGGTGQERVGIVNIDFRSQKRLADLHQTLVSFRYLNDQQIAFRYREPFALQDLQRPLRLRQHQTNNGAIGGIDDVERDDADVGGVELAEDFQKGAHTVFDENVE